MVLISMAYITFTEASTASRNSGADYLSRKQPSDNLSGLSNDDLFCSVIIVWDSRNLQMGFLATPGDITQCHSHWDIHSESIGASLLFLCPVVF